MFVKQFSSLFLIVFFIFFGNNVIFANQSVADQTSNRTDRTIRLIHPFTNDEVTTILPNDYQLVTDFVSFREEMRAMVKEMSRTNKGGIYKPAILDRLDKEGNVIKGRPSITINQDQLVEDIVHRAFTGGNVKIPITYGKDGYEASDVPHLNEVVLSSYTTHFNSYKSGRSKNIQLSAQAIDRIIVGNGDHFSFNRVVGPREVATGYQLAPEIIKGKLVLGIGGGICQTSSTLFNAVDKLELKILERHHHSRDVGYVPKGRDATVSFGGLDFQFQNNTGIPLLIRTYYLPGTITVQIRTTAEYAEILRKELLREFIN